MRFHLLGLVLIASVAVPVLAQRRDEPIDRRVDRIERELRAVQRRVFPGGRFVMPEIQPQTGAAPGANVSGDALSSLTARVDALEAQLRSLTGQIEEAGQRNRETGAELVRLRTELGARLDRLEARPAAEPPAAATPARTPPRPQPAESEPAAATAPDSAEEAYNAGFRLWDAHRYAEAAAALDAAATRYPNTRWTSWMRNLQGRAQLDDNKPATAARILLANYQDNPRGERAADSLFYLGQALTRLNRRAEACRVYDELASVYPNMRAEIRRRIPQARTDARCEEAAAN
ncbi:MAG TPA: tetratricopeptide repeat protein [Allosphingosinicella sp.]|nr:tetratricopeptide repeat protein [Allosphingosinicella sp.]